ncbi:MAG: hypothetical protein KDC38_13275, partial [Planctomycetes bacterium]|nr:hypothetical protein [Planctomycetota bacterium]
MRTALPIVVAFVLFAGTEVHAQPYAVPMGIPFRIDPSIGGDRAGWHLNIPNGLWDWGEQALDIGGSSNL